MRRTRQTLTALAYVVGVHVLCLLTLTLCRVLLLVVNMPAGDMQWAWLCRAMLIGVKFDNLIASYVSALPLVAFSLLALIVPDKTAFDRAMGVAVKVAAWFYSVVYTLGLIIEVANVRYYRFFDNHLNISVTEWFAFASDTAGMIFGDTGNWFFIVVGIVLIVLFWLALWVFTHFFVRRMTSFRLSCQSGGNDWACAIAVVVVSWGLCFCGIRGSFQRYPLNVSFAYFCDHPFYNRLGVNPIFNIIKSAEYIADDLPAMLQVDEHVALTAIRQELHVQTTDSLFPLQRQVAATAGFGKRNVVIVLMESMSTDYLDVMYNGRHITPYLSDLRYNSLYFKHFYSAGVHTNNGITATLYGYGPDFAKATMKVPSNQYMGLPYALQRNGYNTYVFVTGNPQYDNMNSFFYDNSIERIFSLYDYPSHEAVNNFGVPDDYMFSYGLNYLQQRADTAAAPFFALFVTVSNHMPFVIPEQYRDAGADDEQCIVAYADDALRQFMEQAQQSDWGKNTVFVLLGDHGSLAPTCYDYNIRHNMVPCFIVTEGVTDTIVYQPAQQQDITPTIMALLGLPYTDNTMGINQLEQRREYAYFVNNDHLGCSDGEWLYSYGINTHKERLYRLGDTDDKSTLEPIRLQKMRDYAVQHQLINLKAVKHKWTIPCE
ncbi:MAG: LTA synthase family protein [Paludibacteraceae bacterium]